MSDLISKTEEIRRDFPVLQKNTVHGRPVIYFDSSSTSQRPKQVIDAVNYYYQETNSNVHRGLYELSDQASMLYEEAHDDVAKFIGADTDEVIFVRNATEGINLVMYGYGLKYVERGDEIVTTMMEHHSNFVPWQQLALMKDAEFKVCPVNEYGEVELETIRPLITDKTKIVAINHTSNAIGSKSPVSEIIKIAHDHGAIVVVDAAQAAPHYPIDVKKLDADFLTFSGHKMLGPTGSGAVYGKREHLENMNPFLFGGSMISLVGMFKSTWNELPWKFEAGTPNIAGGIGLGAAVRYINNIGMEYIEKVEHELLVYALKRMGELDFVTTYGPPPEGDRRAAIISFNLDDIHSHDVAAILDEYGIAVRAGHHCAQPLLRSLGIQSTSRASFYFYNEKSEIDILVDKLGEVYKIFNQ